MTFENFTIAKYKLEIKHIDYIQHKNIQKTAKAYIENKKKAQSIPPGLFFR